MADDLDNRIEESEELEEEQEIEMAPQSILGYIRFMRDPRNKRDRLSEMPRAMRSRVMRYVGTAALAFALGLGLIVVFRSPTLLVLPILVILATALMAYKAYLDGSRRQYVEIKGVVVRSDYQKSIVEAARKKVKKTMQADFSYHTFVMKKDEEYIRIQCKKAKELPQEGDAVKVTIHGNTKVYEDDGMTYLTDYISIERVA